MVFDRRLGSIVRFTDFALADDAMTARFDAEDEFADNADIEVVVLGAASQDDLRRTHARYFQSAREIAVVALGELRKYEAESRARLAF
ncbi:hypothetical protein [Paractinoplanes hotanensis]|uniref:Uncharacterized protein n=1 Tax=Paractinoplanes hotanensis TaxID=2906497 RepID=A0ABT0YG29_9ACTN|nr:hypothetical protein [Actinoplanes hotanensis]MCM4085013.1 hypothetical protein [Actinoplanes hotanensis]